jgi:hypothetical protein
MRAKKNAQKKKAQQNKKQEAEAEAARLAEDEKLTALVLAEMEERRKIVKLVPKYTETATINMYGYFEGLHWQKMDDEDRIRASNLEVIMNCIPKQDDFDGRFPVYTHVKYENRYFTVGRHSIGHYSVLGMPSVRAQMDPAIPRFSTDGFDINALLDLIGE